MTDFATARINMVEGQVKPNKVTDPVLLQAMLDIPREAFVPGPMKSVSYVDEDIEIAPGRYLTEPMVIARLIAEARIRAGDIVLDIGCATGYSTAVMARLASTVVGLEVDEDLAGRATRTLADQGVDNAVIVTGDLTAGHPDQAPYDVILVNGAVSALPDGIVSQLAEGGRLTCVHSPAGHVGRARLYRRTNGHVSHLELFDAATPYLPGFERKPAFEF